MTSSRIVRLAVWLLIPVGMLAGLISSARSTQTSRVLPQDPNTLTRPRSVGARRTAVPDLGPNASLHGKQLFPPDSPWNQDISNAPIDPNSARLIASIGDGQ